MIKVIIGGLLILNSLLGFSQRGKLYMGYPTESYYKNGNLRVLRSFKEGQILGYKTFYKNGSIRSNYVFNSKGYHDSIANFYYPNGNIKTEWKYKKDVVKKRIDYTLEGKVIKGKKDYNKIKKCNDFLPYGPDNLRWAYNRAKLNSKLGFHDEALEDFNYILSKVKEEWIKQSPLRTMYHTMAIDYAATEDYENALIYNYKALGIEYNNQAVLNNLGSLLLRVKDYDLALKFLDECHRINPENYHAFFNKSKLYLETGNYQKALDFIEKTIADERSHKLSEKHISEEKTIWVTRGELYYILGRPDEAIKDLQKALVENPANSYAYRCLSLIYKSKGDHIKACDALSKAEEYKYDKIYNTNEVEQLKNDFCLAN
ncbi:tetratricopeptide repeat protein [Tamlana haliotis]|uniref:Tetratricopeptide repeat protein n=1 Tax=Pseudotamlana haliotis TaxID=2614804 RepID=A0A6N6MIM2_9FLAO|nr:tetratricopeptide repeat protein [Tamlana haliotis]KAB1069364.1 tetratricopeptide repeat protein [Tamlana haliotis]